MSKLLITAGWRHVPHLDEETKERLLLAFPKHEREARTEGVPLLGSGLIFPVDEKLITIEPFPIPEHWARIIGIDFGWDHPTAAAHLAWDRDADIFYVTAEFRARESLPAMNAAAIKPWGAWIPVAWPHDGLQHSKDSGAPLAEQYKAHGLAMLKDHATHVDGGNGVEAGLMEMHERMLTGRWKVFSTCTGWLEERRTYHRKEGKIVKLRDDVISASRYAFMMRRKAITKPSIQGAYVPRWEAADQGIGL